MENTANNKPMPTPNLALKCIKEKPKYFWACVAYAAMFLICLLARIIMLYSNIYGAMKEEFADVIWSVFSQIIAMSGIPLLIVIYFEKPNKRELFKELGFRHTVKWWVYLTVIPLAILLICVATGLSFATEYLILLLGGRMRSGSSDITNNAGMFILACFTGAVLPGICEETLHRGILVRGFKPHLKDTTLIIITALLFALMHSNINQVIYTFFAGMIMSSLTVKTRSIFPAMILHFLNNFIATYEQYAQTFDWFGGTMFNTIEDWWRNNMGIAFFVWLIATAATIGLTYVIIKYGLIKKIKDEEEEKEKYDFPKFIARDGTVITPIHPVTGKPRFGKMRPFSRLIGEEKVWQYAIIALGILYTAFTLMWRLM